MKRLPLLPRVLHGISGPILVKQVEDLKGENGGVLLGRWDSRTRTIQILTPSNAWTQWHTLYHEEAHAFIWDTHVRVKNEETFCDQYANWQMSSRFGAWRATP